MASDGALQATELCAIIETCARAGVRKIEFRGACVEFGASWALREELTQVSPPLPGQVESIEQETHERDEILAKEQQMAELQLEDPLAYEEAVMREELEEPKGNQLNA